MNILRRFVQRQVPANLLMLVDLGLIVVAILTFITEQVVFYFHIIFVLLSVGAFFWNFRAFISRAIFWVAVDTGAVLLAVSQGRTQTDELIEIPLLTTILMMVFFIASSRATTQSDLERNHKELKEALKEREGLQDALLHQAFYDKLTGLPNRALLFDRLQQVFLEANRHQFSVSLLFIDLDGFKLVNDRFGHDMGDHLLVEVAKRMLSIVRNEDTVARLGGDEFTVLIKNPQSMDFVQGVAKRILEKLSEPYQLSDAEVRISASIGVSMSFPKGNTHEDLVREADIAMYQAKLLGKARIKVFDVTMSDQIYSRLEIENGLRKALENEEFQLYYQPIISLETNQMISLEALIRWAHPKQGTLFPGEFLSIAEESGLILPIDDWVLNEACRQLKAWQDQYPSLKRLAVNVNLSSKQFSQPDLTEKVAAALQKSGLQASALKLEITEGVLISNYSTASRVLRELSDLGVQLQIDDFGTGYSALAYLRRFPINTIKIDKSFIDEIGKSQRGTGIIRAIVAMARELEMDTIAEGIETGKQLNELKNLSCGFGQGFLLSKPLDRESTGQMLSTHGIN